MLPTAKAGGCSGDARPGGPRSRLTGLPGPTKVQRRVLIAVEHQPTGGTDVGTHRETLEHPLPTPAAILGGVCGWHGYDLTPGAGCPGFKVGPQRRPADSTAALGQVGVTYQVGDPHIFA